MMERTNVVIEKLTREMTNILTVEVTEQNCAVNKRNIIMRKLAETIDGLKKMTEEENVVTHNHGIEILMNLIVLLITEKPVVNLKLTGNPVGTTDGLKKMKESTNVVIDKHSKKMTKLLIVKVTIQISVVDQSHTSIPELVEILCGLKKMMESTNVVTDNLIPEMLLNLKCLVIILKPAVSQSHTLNPAENICGLLKTME